VKSSLRAKARRRFGKMMQEAMADPTKETALTRETLQYLSESQKAYVLRTGKMPKGFEFHHLMTIADYPEFGDLAETGLALPKGVHLQVGHGGDVTRPLEAATYADPKAMKRPGYTIDPEAQKGYRVKGADIASGRANTPAKRGGVDVDIVRERQVKLQQFEKSTQLKQSRLPKGSKPDPRDVAELKELKNQQAAVKKLTSKGGGKRQHVRDRHGPRR
jgi:hypothetical protein